jgi:acetyl-CoA acyltransferase
MNSAYIVDIVRTPFTKGKPGGALAAVHPVSLLARTFEVLLERTGVEGAALDDAYVGCVSQVGEQSLNIGRNAVLAAGLPEELPATTVDRQCGSSMQTVAFAANAVVAGAADLVLVGGVESMSRVPLWTSLLEADPYGAEIEARYPGGLIQQGIAAELVASRWGLGRDRLDEYASESHARARRAGEAGSLADQIVPVATPEGTVDSDETIREAEALATIGELKPAFADPAAAERFPEIGEWRVTAGNSSPLTDGAAATLVASESALREHGLEPVARLAAASVVAEDPIQMLTAVIPATRAVLARAGMPIEEISVFEVNEAFACVPLAWREELQVDPERLNPLGGAIAYGHPLGASGLRLLGSTVAALRDRGERYGLQTMCEAGGMANAFVIERC